MTEDEGITLFELMQQREAHYVRHFGPLTEPIMDSMDHVDPHIDIYQFPPHGDRDFWTLITDGMSNLPQELPDGKEHVSELLMYVREPRGWMFNVMKRLAEYPFTDNTFLYWNHTVPNGKPMTAQPSLLTAYMFLPPYFEARGFDPLTIDDTPSTSSGWCPSPTPKCSSPANTAPRR